MASTHASKDGASLADFFHLLRQRKSLIFLVFGIVVLTTAVVTKLLPKWYLSTATIRVEKPEGEVKLFQNQNSNSYDPNFLQDQFKIIQSAKVIYPVIEKLRLNEKLMKAALANHPLTTDYTYEFILKKMLNVESPRGSSLIEINVYAQEAQLAAEIANEITRFYAEDRILFATAGQREGLAQLRKELESQERNVSQQRDSVEKLRKDLNISGVDLNSRYNDMEIDNLRQMQSSLVALSVDAIGRKTRYERFKGIAPDDRISLVNSELIQDPNIHSLLQAFLIADQTVTRMKARLGEAHPELISANENRLKIKEQLDAQLRGYESALEISFKESEARVAELQKQLDEARVGQILSARERMRPFEEATQKLDDEVRLLSTLKVTLRQREIDFQVPKKTIEILNVAEPARRAARPSLFLNLAFAALFGLVLGVATAVFIEYFDTSFRNVAEVEGKLQRPMLGVIPHADVPLPLKPIDDEDPADSEPYRVLHTNLNLVLKNAERGRSLVFLSAGPGEGKSTTLLRLARIMAISGERILLVDADVRRPTQHSLAKLPKEPGLSDFLSGRVSLSAAIQRAVVPNLDFIACGKGLSFTISINHVDALKAMLAELKGQYDRILFDAPPIIGVSDASILASVVDDVVLVIQHRRNPQTMVVHAQQIAENVNRRPLVGVVLNRVPLNSGEDYGYYTRNYAYYSSRSDRRRERSSRGSDNSSGNGSKSPQPASSRTPFKAEKISFTASSDEGRKS